MPKGCLYFDAGPEGYHQLQDVESIEDLADWHPGKMTEESLAGTVEKAKWLHDNTDYAVMTGFGGSILESGQGLRGWGQFMMDMAGDRPLAEEIIGRLTEAHVHNAKVFMAALGDYIQVVQMGDDLGTQDGPQMSPQLYHDLIHPAHKAIYQAAKSAAPQVAIFLHSCGSIRSLIPDLIDEGVELLNPVQTAAADMDPKELNDEYGDKLTFWGGGIETQSVLVDGTPDEVAAMAKERIEIFGPGGGYVFNQVHNIQAGVPPANIIAMYEAAKSARGYPLAQS